uniref:protein piccolo-like n=1 Tax=Scatophagus argus TaxID=75038 RepID=UPI001ED80E62|nr:protein piccolo-like [Scatophagus argus]
MFSSKFLSGANPLNAVSSAVNKFGLFGDDGKGNQAQKAPSQQGVKTPGEQQPGAGPGKGPQQPQGPQKSAQGPPMQNSQPLPKQGSPQLQGNGQAAPLKKPGGQQATPKAGTQPEDQLRGEPQKIQTQGSPKPGAQQQILTKSGAQPESPKASQQQVSPKTGMQKQGPVKTSAQPQEPAKYGLQEATKVGSQKTVSEQGSPKAGQQQQASPKVGHQLQGSPKLSQQQQGSSKAGQQQQGLRTTPQQQSSDKPGPQQQGPKGPGTSGPTQAGSSSPVATKAGSQSKAVIKPLCPVCKTTELNMNTKEPPNYKTCTQCKTEVCSLCGFSPPDSDGREWLCLTCQIQRAQGTAEAPGPSMKKPTPNKLSATQNRTQSPAAPVKKEISAPGSPQKTQPKSAKVPAKGEAVKQPESQKQAIPASFQKMTPDTQRTSGSHKPDQTSQTGRKQSSATLAPQQESGGLFGFGGAKTEAGKSEESVTGKMFGFGSSIFSSASNLIASAVQDEPNTTPPVSPKMQSTREHKPTAVQKSDQDKKQEQPQQAKAQPAGQTKEDKAPSETPKTAATSHSVPKAGQSSCPLCKTVLNMGSKDPPNYNTCTECKSTVCNQCGFNPMPNVKEGKKWLCLTCQVKQATGDTGNQKDTSLANSSFKKTTPPQPPPQKTSAPGSPQRKVSASAVQPDKAEAAKGPESYKQATPAHKTQEIRKTGPQNHPDQTDQTVQKQGKATAPKNEEAGGFFGFGSPKNQIDAVKPAESVTGKMFGFGSSIFSSASTLISSSIQDEPKTTPPVSPKMLIAKDSKSPSAKNPQQEKKPEQQTKGPSAQPRADKPSSEQPMKTSVFPVISKAGQSTCPLCKLELNVGSKYPPNYNTCTVCKNTVCNQCGFNPTPNVKEVKEWLCLNCQMQRALGASEPPGTPMMKLQASPNKVTAPVNVLNKETPQQDKSQKKDIPTITESKIAGPSTPRSPQRKPPTAAEQPAKAEVAKGPEIQKQVSPALGQKTLQEGQKISPQKPSDQTTESGHKQSHTTSSTQEESVGFFGFGGPKPQHDSAKPAESVGGKMFGFGSSILSSASTLINSAVQDDSKKTPPVSPKIPGTKATRSPLAQRGQQEKKLEQVQKTKNSTLLHKVEIAPSEPSKDAVASPAVPKADQSTCPLCKVELNFGSREPPNYNNCTECKNTVCNQCGFNPSPNVSEVKEWLCLNCQMQRALSASQATEPPMKTHKAVEKISPSAVNQKITAANQIETLKKELKSETPLKMETQLADTLQKKRSSTPGTPQKTDSIALTQETKAAKGSQSDTQVSLNPVQKTPLDIVGKSGSQGPAVQASQPEQIKVTQDTQQESGNVFAWSGPKTKPDTSKTTESVTGKMFGFGSSIFSSASTLISSAVQEESRTTPPSSRKMSAPAQVSPKKAAVPKLSPKSTPTVSPKMSPAREPKSLTQEPEQKMKPKESDQSKNDNVPSQSPQMASVSFNADEASCPLCKAELNFGSKDPSNYNTCTECKTTVCNQCGFNPMPTGEVKEWLCLTCQMKRATAATGPLEPSTVKSRTSPSKVPSPAAVQLKDTFNSITPQKKYSPGSAVQKKETSEPVSPQRKQSTPIVQSGKPEATTASQDLILKKPPEQASQPGYKRSDGTTATQQESLGFFGFGGPKSQPTKPAESVTGKMFGLSSSIFSSASTLITSAVQDQPKTTPPVSPKMSPAKEIKSPGAEKLDLQKKIEPSQMTKTTASGQAKLDKAQSEPPKTTAPSQVDVNLGQSTCPLCKVELNMGSKDPPNYNTCTECKNTVCNQCGFNPMPNETVLMEWLCLTCQMQRALGVSEPSGVTSVHSQLPAKPQKKDTINPAQSSAPHSPQRKLSVTAGPVTTETANKPDGQKQSSPLPLQKRPQEPQKTQDQSKTPDETRQTEHKQSNAKTKQEGGGFFGFGSSKTQPDTTNPVPGKMFGFGSSIFGSASTLITSVVQDQPKTTPPVSPKMSPAKEIKSSAAQNKDQEKKPEQPQQTKTPPLVQAKVYKAPSEPQKATVVSHAVGKPIQSICPLCKVELNVGSKDTPNYNTCTECKKTVCNQCGFNPIPNVSEMKEWLCLTCQMQRALTASESVEPPLMKSQASPNKVSTPASAVNQKKGIISTNKAEVPDKNQRDSPTAGAPQKKEEDTSLHAEETPDRPQ